MGEGDLPAIKQPLKNTYLLTRFSNVQKKLPTQQGASNIATC
jgi:hypothetical protein